jgi:DNA polymerase-3 subunit epsilon
MLGPTPLRTGSFVVVDIETTGGRPGTSDIIEIGAVKIEACTVTARFSSLVRPHRPIPAVIADLTGISDDMVEEAPLLADAVRGFCTFAEGSVLVAHNHRFDLGFLDYEAERFLGDPFPRPVLDTLSLARRLQPGLSHYNLRALSDAYETGLEPNHRALTDAEATAAIFLGMLEELDTLGVRTAADAAVYCGVARQGTLARKLTLATHMPDGPGIYLFRDAVGRVVYVGRAKDLRTRVRSYFYAPADPDGRTNAAATESIDHIPCSSRLDALLLESRLLERYRPRFNRERHRLRDPLYLHINPHDDYPAFRVTRRRLRSGVLFGPVSNEWAATTLVSAVSQHFRLRQCGRSAAACEARSCRNRAAGRCPGYAEAGPACAYAERVSDALAIFDGASGTFRDTLNTQRGIAATDEAYEEAIRYRDAVRALDRTLAALSTAARASREPVVMIVEGAQDTVVVHVAVRGWLHVTHRFMRDEIREREYVATLSRALVRAHERAVKHVPVTPRRLRDMVIIDAYRKEHEPTVIVVDDIEDAVRRVGVVMRRMVRVPRKSHGAASGA